MPTEDAMGYLAAALVFCAFAMRTMIALRLIAIASNLAFLVYGGLGELAPIIMLHSALLPMNLVRLYGELVPPAKEQTRDSIIDRQEPRLF